MSGFSRPPCSALRPWVTLLWAMRGGAELPGVPHRERVLPTGAMHIVLRLSDSRLTLFESATGQASQSLGHVIVGGARSSCYVKQGGDSICSVGAQLQPGGASALLGVPAFELAERHTSLDALWGLDAARLREQLWEIMERELASDLSSGQATARAQVDLLEMALLSRIEKAVSDTKSLHWIASTVSALEAGTSLAAIVDRSTVSHRTLITRFRTMVGLSPKMFARIRRFQRVVEELNRASKAPGGVAGRLSLAGLALETGYADQAHLTRDFVEFAGVSPSIYSRLAPTAPNHVRIEL